VRGKFIEDERTKKEWEHSSLSHRTDQERGEKGQLLRRLSRGEKTANGKRGDREKGKKDAKGPFLCFMAGGRGVGQERVGKGASSGGGGGGAGGGGGGGGT